MHEKGDFCPHCEKRIDEELSPRQTRVPFPDKSRFIPICVYAFMGFLVR